MGQVGLRRVTTFADQLVSCWRVLGGMDSDFSYQVSTLRSTSLIKLLCFCPRGPDDSSSQGTSGLREADA